MISLFELALFAGLGIVFGFWWHSVQARETGVAAARAWCLGHGWQLLDETVVLERIRPVRLYGGSLGLWRRYRFEYSDTGNNRIPAQLVMSGLDVLGIESLHEGVLDLSERE